MVSVIIGTELIAAFGVDGTVTGSAGCNNYSAGEVSLRHEFEPTREINRVAVDWPFGL